MDDSVKGPFGCQRFLGLCANSGLGLAAAGLGLAAPFGVADASTIHEWSVNVNGLRVQAQPNDGGRVAGQLSHGHRFRVERILDISQTGPLAPELLYVIPVPTWFYGQVSPGVRGRANYGTINGVVALSPIYRA